MQCIQPQCLKVKKAVKQEKSLLDFSSPETRNLKIYNIFTLLFEKLAPKNWHNFVFATESYLEFSQILIKPK